MSNLFATRSATFPRLFTVTALAGLLIGVGCSDDDSGGNGGTPTPTTSFLGAFVGGGDGGKLTVTVASTMLAPRLRAAKLDLGAGGSRLLRAGSFATHDIGANGSADLSGGPVVSLTGTFNEETDSLNLAGGGYTFVGVYDTTGSTQAILGGYLGPNGVGFFGVIAGNSSTVQVSCGTFENAGASVTGRWNMIINGDDLGGAAFAAGDTEGAGFEGAVTGAGNPRTITFSGGSSSFTLSGTGTWDTTTNLITGIWETSDGISTLDTGTWETAPCE